VAHPLRTFLETLRRLVTERDPAGPAPDRPPARGGEVVLSQAAEAVLTGCAELLDGRDPDPVVLAHHCATWAMEIRAQRPRRSPGLAVLVEGLERLERTCDAYAAADRATREARRRETAVAVQRVLLAVQRPASELTRG